MMEENEEGNMEFPRDVMIEDCFSGAAEPLYGFVTNVTIPEDMLEPCLVGVECYENGTRIENGTNDNGEADDLDLLDSGLREGRLLRKQSNFSTSLGNIVKKKHDKYVSEKINSTYAPFLSQTRLKP